MKNQNLAKGAGVARSEVLRRAWIFGSATPLGVPQSVPPSMVIPQSVPPTRAAFTLIELLVVITLIMILAGLAAAFLPAIGDTARQAQGGSMLQQWILTAKQKALRDQVPCGLRLMMIQYVDPNGSSFAHVVQCQYIEQPDDFPLSSASTVFGNGNTVNCSLFLSNQQVVKGDYLEVLGNGLMHQITNVSPGGGSTTFTLASNLPFAVNPTKQYRIVRAPRITGDDLLQLPDSVIIDLTTNAKYGSSLPIQNTDGSYDILFSPTGAVLSQGLTGDTINLWVRELSPNKPNPGVADTTDGGATIVAIYVRSGLTAAHPPAPVIMGGNQDPYVFIKDGRTSGK